MFIKSDIRKITIALEKAVGHEVFVRLGRDGIIHLARVQGDGLTDTEIIAEEQRTRDILATIGFVLNTLRMDAGEAPVKEKMRDIDQDTAFVSKAKKRRERLQRLHKRIQEETAVVAQQLKYAEALDRMGIDPGSIKKVRFVRVIFGQVTETVPDFEDDSFRLTGTDHYVFGAALPRAAPQMLRFLEGLGFVDRTSEISGLSHEHLKKRESALERRLEVVDRCTDAFRKETGPGLRQLSHSYREYEVVLKAMRLSVSSAKALFITGWIDARDKQRLITLLHEICGGRFVISEERDPNAPVRLMNIGLFKPFELIVKTMGMPANSEIDPTPLAAVTFVLVFGLMFGDLGQGLILAMAGLVLKSIAKKKVRDNLDQAGGILIACGLAAALCGILYGSLFSSEHLIPALWIHPTENVMGLFFLTILLGAIIIVIGLCINIVNASINGDYPEAFLGKKGMPVLILYSAIVLLAMRYANHLQVPAPWEIGAFIVLPLVAFSLRGFLGPLLFQASRPHNMAEYVTETAVEIMEITIGMFANTISFIRVGAFALSHAGLSTVTYTLAGMADPALKTPAAIAILVVGNVFIIGFEGLICAVQSMRLEYYEFFSKFYRGDGVMFHPFALKTAGGVR